jgi:hypothetical protein
VITGAGHCITGRRDSQRANRRAGRAGAPKGWEFVHVCVDDATRLAYAEVLTDEKATTAVAFLGRAVAFYTAHGTTVQRVMTDNGSAYRSTLHTLACRALGPAPPAHPALPAPHQRQSRTLHQNHDRWAGTNGTIYATSRERAGALDGWLWTYNHRRPRGALSTSSRSLASTSSTTCLGSTTSARATLGRSGSPAGRGTQARWPGSSPG